MRQNHGTPTFPHITEWCCRSQASHSTFLSPQLLLLWNVSLIDWRLLLFNSSWEVIAFRDELYQSHIDWTEDVRLLTSSSPSSGPWDIVSAALLPYINSNDSTNNKNKTVIIILLLLTIIIEIIIIVQIVVAIFPGPQKKTRVFKQKSNLRLCIVSLYKRFHMQ